VKRVLRDRSTSGGPRLAFASGIWADASTSLSPKFVEAAGNVYGAAAKKADFVNKVGTSSYRCNIAGYAPQVLDVMPVQRAKSRTPQFVIGLFFRVSFSF
jgi:hypothetical protein